MPDRAFLIEDLCSAHRIAHSFKKRHFCWADDFDAEQCLINLWFGEWVSLMQLIYCD